MADKKRRRSLHIFRPRPETPDSTLGSTPSATSSPVEARTPRLTPAENGHDPSETAESPKARPRTLQKDKRSSVFGSLRSLHSWDEDEKGLARSDSKASSIYGDGTWPGRATFGEYVKRSAEVQIASGSVFRKKTQYVVLTESHLIRFKNQSKASEMFPSIPHTGKSSFSRGTMSSVGSYTDMQTNTHADVTQGIPLEEVVAVYKVEDGRPYFTFEVSSLDECGRGSASMQLCFNDPKEAEAWLSAIRESAGSMRLLQNLAPKERTLEYVAQIVERDRDYDPAHFHVFKVAQRAPIRPASRAFHEELVKTNTNVCYLVIGINKAHFIPIPPTSGRSSTTSLAELDAPSSFGITSLTAVKMQTPDDSFQLHFRTPLRQSYVALLASSDAPRIALWLRYQAEYLRPEYVVQPFTFSVPAGLEDQMNPPSFLPEDNNCFDRTLIAYCAAMDVDTSRIYYSVDYECEDAPCFRLLPPATGSGYSPAELLAVMRALRYNETFTSISFANVNLRPLRDLYDSIGEDDDSLRTRSGTFIQIPGHSELSILQHEIRALALKSRRLRRVDFSHAMSRLSSAYRGQSSCGIPEALTPLCKKSLTNVDWIVLTGIPLSDTDLDYLVDAASERQCHIRALEIGDCGLSIHDVDVLLSTLRIHDDTMEVIDITGAQGRFSCELFQKSISAFSRIRRLNLTRIQKAAGPEPLVAPEILMNWRLESLQLNGTTLNEQMVDNVAAYLASSRSDTLRELSVNQCNLTGRDLAVFLSSMTRDSGVPRNMHVSANENRLGTDCGQLSKSIARNHAPASLSMRMIDFQREVDFRELIYALTDNTILKSLDISRSSLPYDASMEACEALRDMFAKNSVLEELDISGDLAHLDVARFGIGLNVALTGLEKNKALRSLKIEHQNLGLQGASTLARVIETNTTLAEIHCEHNDINLQSFTVLVNALAKNKTLLYLPSLDSDRAKSLEVVRNEFMTLEKLIDPQSPKTGMIRKVVMSNRGHRRYSSTTSANSVGSFSEHDITATITALEEKWQCQVERLQKYLIRNYDLAVGASWNEYNAETDDGRPTTTESLGKLLARVKLDRTPLADFNNSPLDMLDEKITARNSAIFTLPED